MQQNLNVKSIYKRLPVYLEHCKELIEKDPSLMYITSKKIANDLFLGEVQVRKDLSKSCGHGRPKTGYNIHLLIESIQNYLRTTQQKKAVIFGVGKLGSALVEFEELKNYGLDIVLGVDPNTQSHCIETIDYNIDLIKEYITKENINIAIICTPKIIAQEICDLVIPLGIKAIWNFAPIRLNVPKGVIVQNENLAYSVSVLSSFL